MVCRYGLLAERLPPPTSHSWGALPRCCTASLHPGNCAHGTCYGQLALRWAHMGSGPLRRVPGFLQGHRASRLARRRCRTTNCFRRATPRGFVAFSGRWTTARLGPLTPLVDVVPSAPFVFPRRSRQNLTLGWWRVCELRSDLRTIATYSHWCRSSRAPREQLHQRRTPRPSGFRAFPARPSGFMVNCGRPASGPERRRTPRPSGFRAFPARPSGVMVSCGRCASGLGQRWTPPPSGFPPGEQAPTQPGDFLEHAC